MSMILIPIVYINYFGHAFVWNIKFPIPYSDGNILTLLCPEIIKNKYFHYSET